MNRETSAAPGTPGSGNYVCNECGSSDFNHCCSKLDRTLHKDLKEMLYGLRAELDQAYKSRDKALAERDAAREMVNHGLTSAAEKADHQAFRAHFLSVELEELKRAGAPAGCVCPGDATPHCRNQLCPRKPIATFVVSGPSVK